MGIALELKAVSRRYGATVALNGVDLDVEQGQAVAVLGPNGAGKTTMLSIALGLLSPDEGTARVFGRLPAEALKRGEVGALLQDAGLLDDVRVAELVAAVAGMYPRPMPVERVMQAAGVQDLAGRRVGRLSGGQQQRVRFALALAGDPALLVLDEPTVGLDVESRRALWQEVRARTAAGRTVVFATHYLTEADDYADRIVLLADGEIVADGPVDAIKSLVGGTEIRFRTDRTDVSRFERLPGVRQVRIEGRTVALRTGDSDATLRTLFATFDAFDDVRDVRTASTDLESAFVSLTGGQER
ncbi:ABC transporter ATP-binding protein [Nonomuraea angiospora]|uniref:ABC-2 type transport system ATP-binding protein n=1 Tax=Nonomuraea angiospora TaxID=46172 RepID=A0ABR9LR30_9ACTN|nr:ABC transporter ATP-binding protein [Nonomuraea angiospora]MBE1583113.1 ABC-2 type transport system ATP-binding protein [Nonomuraea angiospora]